MKVYFGLIFFLFAFASSAQYPVLSQRDQSRVIDELTEYRLRHLLPSLMRREGIDMWVLIARENNDDPVMKTMLPAAWMSARRTTMLVIFDRGADKELEFLAVARYDVGNVFKKIWDPSVNIDQWVQLSKVIEERNPKKIGINKAEYFSQADGLTISNYDRFIEKLPKRLHAHITSAQNLSVAWLETRSEREMAIYPQLCKMAHQIIQEGLSEKVILPGVTSTDDVEWWYREKIKELKLDTWFHPTVDVQRKDADDEINKLTKPLVILPGDLLHVDFGISYLRLNTDTQQLAYVLKSGETVVPEFLANAFKRGNKLQDILTTNFKEGKTGNQILADARKQATDQGITPSIYTHPIGFYGHGSGTTIGMWDMQNGVPHVGDYPLHLKTAYSIELNATVYIIEWKKEVKIMLEEDGYFDENGFRYIDGRQTELMTIPRMIVTR